MYMFEERLMPPEPEDELESLFAAEERAIRDDGFSARVVERSRKSTAVRQLAIYGSGLAGLGFAVGGIVELAPHLTGMSSWIDGVVASVESVNLAGAVQGASDSALLVIVALTAGITFLLSAVTLQNR